MEDQLDAGGRGVRSEGAVAPAGSGPSDGRSRPGPGAGPCLPSCGRGGKVVMNGIAADEVSLPALPLVSNSYQVVDSAPRPEVPCRGLDLVASGVKP